MAGQGQGMLQPTKLILTDDFHDNLALPGYQTEFVANIATYPAGATGGVAGLFVVPDGTTVEVIDFGVTAQADIVETASTTTSTIKLDAVLGGTTTNIVAAANITGGGGATKTLSAGSTASIKRGSVPASGDAGYAFTAASKAVNNQFAAGSLIQATIADDDGTGATGAGLIFVRLKFVSNDQGAI